MSAERVRLADVQPTSVEWLWRGYVPLGKLTLVEGDPGLGKSTVLLDLAARASVGGTTPTGEPLAVLDTLLVTAEDDASDTIRPRLDRAGGDPARIHHVSSLTLPDDVDELRRHVAETGAKLIVVDPIVAHLRDGVRTENDHQVRRALAPVVDVAGEFGCAAIAVRHLRKGEGPALYRGGGTIGFAGLARSVLAVARDPDDEDRAVLASTKVNVARRPASLAYRLVADGPFDIARVAWEGESDHSAESLIGTGQGIERRPTKIQQMADSIRRVVVQAGGEIAAKDANDALDAEGWTLNSNSLITSARQRAGVESYQPNIGAPWLWRLARDDRL